MPFERARSADAKQLREDAILRSATDLALARGIRDVTLTDIAAGVGMHKSTMLRYFETREEIFLRLARTGWPEWAAAVVAELQLSDNAAEILASTLVARPLFCELLAHVPLNLERGVSAAAVKDFKVAAITAADDVATALQQTAGIDLPAAGNVVATATAMAGALWQMAAPGTELRKLYESDPDLAHAIVDVEPRLTDILTALLTGYTSQR
ncbi:TetR family transcriptional regulator [Kribbella sp. NPDC059898]|uniref:TetR family transcriptional regulator n=1 Tax=Kribbella sp. NPDC059898 TaxID=3346995 RepID=UPI00364EF049